MDDEIDRKSLEYRVGKLEAWKEVGTALQLEMARGVKPGERRTLMRVAQIVGEKHAKLLKEMEKEVEAKRTT